MRRLRASTHPLRGTQAGHHQTRADPREPGDLEHGQLGREKRAEPFRAVPQHEPQDAAVAEEQADREHGEERLGGQGVAESASHSDQQGRTRHRRDVQEARRHQRQQGRRHAVGRKP